MACIVSTLIGARSCPALEVSSQYRNSLRHTVASSKAQGRRHPLTRATSALKTPLPSDSPSPSSTLPFLPLPSLSLLSLSAASGLALLLPRSASAEETVTSAVQIASEALSAQGMSLTDACAQELGVSDLNTLIVVACAVEFVALTGAAVGGYLARMRKNEVEKINAQLRQININLRKQARVESYAPALSYAPVGAPAVAKIAAASVPATVTAPSTVPPRDPQKEEVLQILRRGKQFLRKEDNAGAAREFQSALALAQKIGDVVEIKKAARGVGASFQRQGKYQDAIRFHQLVLDTSAQCKEHSGDTEAYGAIADCYTELGDLEQAAKFYDMYINRLEDED